MTPFPCVTANSNYLHTIRASFSEVRKTSARRAKKIHWSVWCSAIAIMTVAIGISVGWAFRTSDLDGAPSSSFSGRTISLEMTLKNIDPLTDGGALTVSWNILDDTCIPTTQSECPAVYIYMDE